MRLFLLLVFLIAGIYLFAGDTTGSQGRKAKAPLWYSKFLFQ